MYGEKPKDYFEESREDLVALVTEGAHKVLEIGAASGNTGLVLKRSGKASEVVGVELCPGPAQEACAKIDRVIVGDIEKLELPFPEEYFDYIICGDVLEHLIDPWATLRKLQRLLSRDGYLIASMPNMRYWRFIRDLAFCGKWEYEAIGLMDKTHLRFFTRKGTLQLLGSSGFQVEKVILKLVKVNSIANLITFGIFREFLSDQILVVASRKNEKGFL